MTGEVSEWVEKLEIGINYQSGKPGDLFAKLEFLITNKKLLSTYKINSFNAALLFDQDIQTKKLLDIINTIRLTFK